MTKDTGIRRIARTRAFLLSLAVAFPVFAQEIDVHGRVFDSNRTGIDGQR